MKNAKKGRQKHAQRPSKGIEPEVASGAEATLWEAASEASLDDSHETPPVLSVKEATPSSDNVVPSLPPMSGPMSPAPMSQAPAVQAPMFPAPVSPHSNSEAMPHLSGATLSGWDHGFKPQTLTELVSAVRAYGDTGGDTTPLQRSEAAQRFLEFHFGAMYCTNGTLQALEAGATRWMPCADFMRSSETKELQELGFDAKSFTAIAGTCLGVEVSDDGELVRRRQPVPPGVKPLQCEVRFDGLDPCPDGAPGYMRDGFKEVLSMNTEATIAELKMFIRHRTQFPVDWQSLSLTVSDTPCYDWQPCEVYLGGASTLKVTLHVVDVAETSGYPVVQNDRPGGADLLSFSVYADALAEAVVDSEPPLTVGVYGPWGSGKTFLMQRVQKKLEFLRTARNKELQKPKRRKSSWWCCPRRTPTVAPAIQEPCPVSYITVLWNAWLFAGSDRLWAAMLSSIYKAVEERYGAWRVRKYFLKKALLEGTTTRCLLWSTFVVVFLLAVVVVIAVTFSNAVGKWFGIGAALLIPALGVLRGLLLGFQICCKSRADAVLSAASRASMESYLGFMHEVKEEVEVLTALLREETIDGHKQHIVLFVDDLDRCPKQRCVAVLEAVTVLLSDASAPFVTFLGIDARVIVSAIEAQLGEVNGYEYLHKIVQLPFCIPVPLLESKRNFVNTVLLKLAGEAPVVAEPPLEPATPPKKPQKLKKKPGKARRARDSGAGAGMSQVAAPAKGPGFLGVVEEGDGGGDASQAPMQVVIDGPPENKADEPFAQTPPAAGSQGPVVLPTAPTTAVAKRRGPTAVDRELFQEFAYYLDGNPRKVKRVCNVFALFRGLIHSSKIRLPPAVPIKWCILLEMWPYRVGWMVQYWQDAVQRHEVSVISKMNATDSTNTLGSLPQFDPTQRTTLKELYFKFVSTLLYVSEDSDKMLQLDGDPEVFALLLSKPPTLYTDHIDTLLGFSINLNPALQRRIAHIHASIKESSGLSELANARYATRASGAIARGLHPIVALHAQGSSAAGAGGSK